MAKWPRLRTQLLGCSKCNRQSTNRDKRIISFAAALRRAEQAYEGQSSRLQAAETSLAEARAKLKAQEDKQEGRSLIHPSNVPKPPISTGRKEDWEKFKHVFVAWTATVHPNLPEMLEKSRVSDKPLDDEMNTPEEDQLSKALYTFLIQYCPEPTMNVIGHGLQGTNGFEVWRRLCKLSEPSYESLGLATSLVQPSVHPGPDSVVHRIASVGS